MWLYKYRLKYVKSKIRMNVRVEGDHNGDYWKNSKIDIKLILQIIEKIKIII
jgi:hypothetical protein